MSHYLKVRFNLQRSAPSNTANEFPKTRESQYFFSFFLAVDFPPNVRIVLLEKMADVEYRLAAGSSERLQLGSLLAAFNTARALVAKQVA